MGAPASRSTSRPRRSSSRESDESRERWGVPTAYGLMGRDQYPLILIVTYYTISIYTYVIYSTSPKLLYDVLLYTIVDIYIFSGMNTHLLAALPVNRQTGF